jgi:hypothetical protein
MAGMSQDVTSPEVIPLLAHDVVLHGYQLGRPTEFLLLLRRYVRQSEELTTFAAQNASVRIDSCKDVEPLLHILGYRIQGDCGQSEMTLVTADSERAFLTIDSGFPLLDLEEALQHNAPFRYNYSGTAVPILFTPADWIVLSALKGQPKRDFLDSLLYEPELARLYWAMSRIEPNARDVMQKKIGLPKLLPLAAVLDLYGSQICVRDGAVVVPGGAAAEKDWQAIVGANPKSPADFIYQLLTKDHGWLTSYYDSMARASLSQQAHFAKDQRLRRYYAAFISAGNSADAAVRLAFRPAPALMVLVNRMQWDANGDPYVPGSLQAWTEILRQDPVVKNLHKWAKRGSGPATPDDLAEAMFALTRVETDAGPVQAYLCLTELDHRRASGHRLNNAAVVLLARRYPDYADQYLLFSEFPDLNDESITRFITIADTVSQIHDHSVRGNAMGIFQANVGLWQIFARQREIDPAQLNSSWMSVLKPFSDVTNAGQVFTAGRASLDQVFRSATGRTGGTQEELINLLAGAHQSTPEGQRIHTEIASKIRLVMEDQRLVSIDTLFALDDGLKNPDKSPEAKARLASLAGELREFEMPQPIFTSGERTSWAAGTYNNRHTEIEMRADFMKAVSNANTPAQVDAARGQLVTFFRDTLVGLNYAYYEPPGSQVLHNNSLFVRSHDFSGETVMGVEHLWRSPRLFGVGSPAGGGAHLIGSLADLPYVLAETEQDFIAPDHVQSLIWQQFVPEVLSGAVVPRWWNVSPTELHAVALYQRAGEELLTSANDDDSRAKIVTVLSDRMSPERRAVLEQTLKSGDSAGALTSISPADSFYLTAEFRTRYSADLTRISPAGRELDSLLQAHKDEIDWDRLSSEFGIIHPVFTQTYGRELINVRPFPSLGGNYSRLMGECWDSGNLYWARLADEMGYSPVLLNRLVPVLTRRMVERIAASDLDDWPATLRALRETGEEFRHGKIAALAGGVDTRN